MDNNSLYSPIEGKKEFVPQELVTEESDLLLRQEKMRRITERMQKILSPEKIGKNDRKRLDQFLEREEYRDVWPVLKYMKEHGEKLEQECLQSLIDE